MNLSRFKNDSSKIGFKDELEGEGGQRLRRVQPPQRVGDADGCKLQNASVFSSATYVRN